MRTLNQLNTRINDIVYFCGVIEYKVMDKVGEYFYLSLIDKNNPQLWVTPGTTKIWTKEQDTYELCPY